MRFILILLCAVLLPTQAYAWACFTLKILEQKYLYVHDYELIFRGKVASIRDMSPEERQKYYPDKDASWKYAPQLATFRIEKKYKGILSDTIEVPDFKGSGPRTTYYKVGQSYYVFANKKNDLATPMGCVGRMYGMEDSTKAQITLERLRVQAEMFDEFIAEKPDQVIAYIEQAKFFEDFDDYQRAQITYKKGLEQLRKNTRHLDNSTKQYVKKKNKRYRLILLEGYGRLLNKTGQYEAALGPLGAVISMGYEESATGGYHSGVSSEYAVAKLKIEPEKFDNKTVKMPKVKVDELDLSNINLSGSDFSEITFNKLVLSGGNFENTNFSGMKGGNLFTNNASFVGANFDNSKIYLREANNADFRNASFKNADIQLQQPNNMDFSGADFSNATIQFSTKSDIDSINFYGANIEGAMISNLSISTSRDVNQKP